MTDTLRPPRVEPSARPTVAAGPTPGTLTVVRPRGRVRPVWLLAGVALAVVAGLAALFVVDQVQTQSTVVVVRGDVARGEQITAADLGEVTVGTVAGVSVVPAAELPTLIGQYARVDLVRGSLLPDGAVTTDLVPAAGQALVGMRLEQGRLPSGPLAPAARLLLVATAPPQGSATGTGSAGDTDSDAVFDAVLVSSDLALDGSATLLNVVVDDAVAARVARLAAADRIAVVQAPQR